MNKVNILNIPITNTTKAQFSKKMMILLEKQKRPIQIVTANPEIIMLAKENPTYEGYLRASDHVVADGIGVVMGAKMLGTPLQERIAGYELLLEFLSLANVEKHRFYFYGGKPGVAQKAAEEAKKRFPNAQIVGVSDGYGGDGDGVQVAEKIAKLKPTHIFVALGAPKQEEWIAEHAHRFQNVIMMGVGGSFDVLSGQVNRAPELFIRLNLEWFYRLITQPTRAKRMLKIPQFLLAVQREKRK